MSLLEVGLYMQHINAINIFVNSHVHCTYNSISRHCYALYVQLYYTLCRSVICNYNGASRAVNLNVFTMYNHYVM